MPDSRASLYRRALAGSRVAEAADCLNASAFRPARYRLLIEVDGFLATTIEEQVRLKPIPSFRFFQYS